MIIHLARNSVAILTLTTLAVTSAFAADTIVPHLESIAQGKGAQPAPNAAMRWEKDIKGQPALFTRSAVWLDGINFSEGTLECDILGKSNPRGSNFLGLAFHGKDSTTFECVYFRPFNFRAENPENAAHAVQYIAHPEWPWQKLRAERTGQFEKPITPQLNGDAWFRAKIVVTTGKVSVYVNDASQPSLEVERLGSQNDGKVAIWGGDAGEGGYFANLKITAAK